MTKVDHVETTWVVQTSFLGDCILALPMIYRLAETSKSKIVLISGKAGKSLFELALERGLKKFQSRISIEVFDKRKLHSGPRGLMSFAQTLRSKHGNPDSVYLLQRSFRSALLGYLSKAPRRFGFSSGAASFFYTDVVPRDWNSGEHEIEKNLSLLSRAREHNSVATWAHDPASPSLLAPASRQPTAPDVLLSLGSPWATKRWSITEAGALVQKLTRQGLRVGLIGSPGEEHLGADLRKLVPSLLLEDYIGKTSIQEWVDLISSTRLLISNDSAAVHAASDANIPVLALFGPTSPDFGFAPWRRNSKALGLAELKCRPCHIHGPKVCPLGHHKCMTQLSSELVHRHAASILQIPF